MTTSVRVLIVEDSPDDAELMVQRLKEEGFHPDWQRVESEPDYLGALETIPDLILADWSLPHFSGLRALQLMRERGLDIPFIVVSGRIGEEAAVEALHRGVFDYVSKDRPARLGQSARHALDERRLREERKRDEERIRKLSSAVEQSPTIVMVTDVEGRIEYVNPKFSLITGYSLQEIIGQNAVNLGNPSSENTQHMWDTLQAGREWRGEFPNKKKSGELYWEAASIAPIKDAKGMTTHFVKVAEDITERKRLAQEIEASYQKLQRTLQGTIEAIARMSEMKDPYTTGHQQRVAQISCAIAHEMGYPEDKISQLRIAGLLHDVGKVQVPSEILSKPGRLSDVEFNMIKTHSKSSYEILKTVEFPWPIADFVAQHHERMDGSGYPEGLSGEQILIEARILAVADVVEAMASHRPYRPALGIDVALAEIKRQSGKLFDADVVEACLEIFKKGFKIADV